MREEKNPLYTAILVLYTYMILSLSTGDDATQIVKHAEKSTVSSIVRSTKTNTPAAIKRSEKELIVVILVTWFSHWSSSQRARGGHSNMCTPTTALGSMAVREAIPQEIMQTINVQTVQSKACQNKIKEKMRRNGSEEVCYQWMRRNLISQWL